MSIFSNYFNRAKSELKASGSAFVRVAEHDTSIAEAHGKIMALKAANAVANAAAAELETATLKVHAAQDAIKARLAAIHASL